MKLILPNNNLPERQYAATILFENLLNIDIEFSHNEQQYSMIELSNGKSILIEDHFFNQYTKPNTYICFEAIPQNVVYAQKIPAAFLPEANLPILFGTDKLELSETQAVIGIDIFASIFFCLTRWEEAANPIRDAHDRFPAYASIAHKFGYLQRPIVNELATFLGHIIIYLGEEIPKPNRKFEFWPTHDVDLLYRWPNWFSFLKRIAGDFFKRFDAKSVLSNISSGFGTLLRFKPDPYDTYDFLMNLSDKYGFKSHFYFLAGGDTKFDNNMGNDIHKAVPIMEKVAARGHIIGIHPSYRSADNESIFKKEAGRLRSLAPQSIRYGRQHFLRFNAMKTWGFWEQNGLEIDSTLGYPEVAGFRCGICTPFPVFDVNTRKQLNLIEAPLTAMDATYAVYQKTEPTAMETELLSLIEKVKKYNGIFVLLWHNSSFNVPEYQQYAAIYERILAAAKAAS